MNQVKPTQKQSAKASENKIAFSRALISASCRMTATQLKLFMLSLAVINSNESIDAAHRTIQFQSSSFIDIFGNNTTYARLNDEMRDIATAAFVVSREFVQDGVVTTDHVPVPIFSKTSAAENGVITLTFRDEILHHIFSLGTDQPYLLMALEGIDRLKTKAAMRLYLALLASYRENALSKRKPRIDLKSLRATLDLTKNATYRAVKRKLDRAIAEINRTEGADITINGCIPVSGGKPVYKGSRPADGIEFDVDYSDHLGNFPDKRIGRDDKTTKALEDTFHVAPESKKRKKLGKSKGERKFTKTDTRADIPVDDLRAKLTNAGDSAIHLFDLLVKSKTLSVSEEELFRYDDIEPHSDAVELTGCLRQHGASFNSSLGSVKMTYKNL